MVISANSGFVNKLGHPQKKTLPCVASYPKPGILATHPRSGFANKTLPPKKEKRGRKRTHKSEIPQTLENKQCLCLFQGRSTCSTSQAWHAVWRLRICRRGVVSSLGFGRGVIQPALWPFKACYRFPPTGSQRLGGWTSHEPQLQCSLGPPVVPFCRFWGRVPP